MKKLTLLLLCILMSSLLMAQDSIVWEDLTDEEQQLLAPLQQNWNNLNPQRQQNLLFRRVSTLSSVGSEVFEE